MPLPMVHLSIAVRLSAEEGLFPSADFLLGNISPDAIHMRPGANKQDKERVHLIGSGDSPRELLRAFQARFGKAALQPGGFAAGYATHLLTDLLWRQAVIDPFREQLLPGLPDKEVRSLYYHDTDQIDRELYGRVPWRLQAWDGLKAARAADFPPFLSAEEIRAWRERTLLWFEVHGSDPNVDPVHISLQREETFISQAAKEIGAILPLQS